MAMGRMGRMGVEMSRWLVRRAARRFERAGSQSPDWEPSCLRISDSGRSLESETPSACHGSRNGVSKAKCVPNQRLGTREPRGFPDGSRGLSIAIPPDRFKRARTLKGVPDPSRDSTILPPLQGESAVSLSGGIAMLNPRLPSFTPPGYRGNEQSPKNDVGNGKAAAPLSHEGGISE